MHGLCHSGQFTKGEWLGEESSWLFDNRCSFREGFPVFKLHDKMGNMPHLRSRHLTEPFRKLSAHTKILGVLGHRQVGKTTFIEAHCGDYRSMDDEFAFEEATRSPTQFLSRLNGRLSCIDECQLVPRLFPALKLRVQKSAAPGQFVLSGSVRFTSRKAIRESLTGRIANLELFPLVLTELRQEPLSDFFTKILEVSHLNSWLAGRRVPSSALKARRTATEKYVMQGGLPGICFTRDAGTRDRILRDLLMTILDRDLRLVYPTTVPYSQIFELCRCIAKSPMAPIHWSTLRTETGLTEKTLRKLVSSLEAVFLLRSIPIEGGGAKGPVYFFEDQIESFAFTQEPLGSSPLEERTGLLYRNIRAQFEYRLGLSPRYFHYLTRGNARIPLAIQSGGEVVGIYPVESSKDITRSMEASVGSFLRRYARAKVVYVSFESFELEAIDSRTCIVPAEVALF